MSLKDIADLIQIINITSTTKNQIVTIMNTKQQIIDKINKIDDPELLDELNGWIGSLLEVSDHEKYSEEELAAVREGYEEYRAGKTVTQAEANRIFNEWLKEN